MSQRGTATGALVVAGCLCVPGGLTLAAPARDGCPAFTPKDHTDFGFHARTDTSLGVSRLGVATRATHVDSDVDRGYLVGSKLFGVYSTPNDGVHGFTVAISLDHAVSNGGAARLGNASALVGYRNSRFVVADAARFGWAVRVGTGLSLFDQDEDPIAVRFAAAAPLDVGAHAYERPILVSGEARFELVGCTAGFIHARLDHASWYQPRADGRSRFDVLAGALSIGAYVRPRVGVAFEAGTQLAFGGEGAIPVRITRVGASYQRRFGQRWTVLGQLAALSGSIDGVDAAVAVQAWLP